MIQKNLKIPISKHLNKLNGSLFKKHLTTLGKDHFYHTIISTRQTNLLMSVSKILTKITIPLILKTNTILTSMVINIKELQIKGN
jgi:hypothetical protein